MTTVTYAQVVQTYRTFRFVHGIRESIAMTAKQFDIPRERVCEVLNLDPKYCVNQLFITTHVVVYSTLESIITAVEESCKAQGWGSPAEIQVTPTRAYLIYELAVDPATKTVGL